MAAISTRVSASATVLAVDIASGGATASLIGSELRPIRSAEVEWTFIEDADGAAGLSADFALESIAAAVRSCTDGAPAPEAMVLSSMMHTLVVLSTDGSPRSPVFTWQDRRDGSFMEPFRDRLGDYTRRTGCYFHPSFPAFKLAWLRGSGSKLLDGEFRLASLKGYVQGVLTGNWAEDVSTASSSGLLDLGTGDWDRMTLGVLEISPDSLPPCIDSLAVAGELSAVSARRLGLPESLPVVAGAGDGFFAATGSGCRDQSRAAVTLGTTAGVRRFIRSPEDSAGAGSFCYRYDSERFLNGCASSNGGNVLDWANEALGPLVDGGSGGEPAVFMPFLNGERAPLWNSALRPRWLDTNKASLRQLQAGVLESQAFQLAIHIELTAGGKAGAPDTAVLSGNAFGTAGIAPMFAALAPVRVFEPDTPGLATLRGAACCGFEALGVDVEDAVEDLMDQARTIEPASTPGLNKRYARFKKAYFGRSGTGDLGRRPNSPM